jgi:membrane-associated protease RseP (regulator of RpoE activity)
MMPLQLRRCGLALVAALATPAFGTDPGGSPPGPIDPNPMLGVEMSPVSSSQQEKLGLDPYTGVSVQDVFPGTAASSMGLQRGDVITHVNGLPITSMTDLRNEVGSSRTGDQVDVVVRRGAQEMRFNDTLKTWPEHIPREPINAEAEARFRQYQAARSEKQGQQVAEATQAVQQTQQELASLGETPRPAGDPGREALTAAAAAGDPEARKQLDRSAPGPLAWRLSARIVVDRRDTGAPTRTTPTDPAAPPAWRFQVAATNR